MTNVFFSVWCLPDLLESSIPVIARQESPIEFSDIFGDLNEPARADKFVDEIGFFFEWRNLKGKQTFYGSSTEGRPLVAAGCSMSWAPRSNSLRNFAPCMPQFIRRPKCSCLCNLIFQAHVNLVVTLQPANVSEQSSSWSRDKLVKGLPLNAETHKTRDILINLERVWQGHNLTQWTSCQKRCYHNLQVMVRRNSTKCTRFWELVHLEKLW